MDHLEAPQVRCRAGFARADITPLVGIYHRLWGAATHERATGVHRPLTATALWLEAREASAGVPASAGAGADDRLKRGLQPGTEAILILALDQCLLDREDIVAIQQRVAEATPLRPHQVHVACSHTHASGWMSLSRAPYPGGELVGPYLRHLTHVCAELAVKARDTVRPATVVFGTARCSLAANRDHFDAERKQFVCGFNPAGPADDTVLVGKVAADDGPVLGTLVNYACHPTTLAWENTLLSPDFIGATRQVVERHTAAPCLFLQGASGDLGPRDGFTGDPAVADRNGRQLGFAALSGLEALPPPGTSFRYAGPVVSGATLGIWRHEPVAVPIAWRWRTVTVDLPYRPDLPTVEQTQAELAKWEREEAVARTADDLERSRDCRAHAERMTRQLNRLRALPPGPTYPYTIVLGRTGTALWVLAPGELYHVFQTTLRAKFADAAVIVATLVDDWQPGYLPTATSYGHGIYQETIAVIGAGGLERLIEEVSRQLGEL
jgi:hypothetical protein